MHVIIEMLWRRRGQDLKKNRMIMFDLYFTKLIQSSCAAFSEAEDKLHFDWGKNLASYVTGKTKGKYLKLELGRDVDMVYAPMMWGADHWVGMCINLLNANVTILDSYIPHNRTIEQVDAHMAPLLSSLPYISKQYVGHTVHHAKEGQLYYSCSRVDGIYNNGRTVTAGLVQLSSLRCMLMVMARRR